MKARDTGAGEAEGRLPRTADAATGRVSSPVSTGGGGTGFEQHVGAYWLAQLLVGGIPPILIDTTVAEVSFQTERLGWQTDDFLVTCRCGSTSRNLACQVKRKFTVSASDDDCVQAITDFWNDFNGAHFSKEHDRLALVTLRGTNTLLEHFVGLLDCARASRDGAEFNQRLATNGFIDKAAVRYCKVLQKIVGDVEEKPVTAADLWPFLRALHLLSLDLQSSTRQTESNIRSMLALTASDGDPVECAAASWNELVGEANAAMAASRSLRREDLQAATLARHGVIGTNERRVLQALGDHTAPVLHAIRSTLGRDDLHLTRTSLVQKVLDTLENVQVVLVAGPAGSGKSAIGKDAVGVLATDHFRFGFRVEEFAQAHLDATLAAAQVPANWTKLSAILGAQDRKVVLVESVERLLEKTTRDAFTDLITLAARDSGLRIVLTCRDYSVEQVRASFLQPHRIQHKVIRVPPLDDAELADAEAAYPALAIPLKSPALRNMLRNPFVLDKALDIPWSAGKSIPQTEREFRALFWREIVRGHRGTPAMGLLRQEVLQTIAVRRARALSSHVPTTGLDPEVVESLCVDSLLTSSDDNPLLVATAHDVLEDWAILQWLEEQHLAEASFKTLSSAIGTHPAVRRSYRKWVSELIERDATGADRLFQAAVSDNEISVQFCDDTLVSLLKAPTAPDFLDRHEAQLIANDRAILKRVIHLLRVACVKSPDLLAGLRRQGSILNVPDGLSWPAVLRLVHCNLAAFADGERGLLLGLIEDTVRGVSWWAPDLEGAEDVAGIAHWLLDGLRGYGRNEPRSRVLKVLAKIPNADPTRFEVALRGHVEGEHLDDVAEDFRKLIYEGIDSMPAARDFPDVVISIAEDHLLASKEDINDQHRYEPLSLNIDLYFGIKSGLARDSFPSSALRGPWITLLRYHTGKALEFYFKVFNHSADWYAHPRQNSRLEEAWEVELSFADGTRCKQWTNARLWGLYRGMSVGSHSLESMLMALETWLLELGKNDPEQLDGILISILRRSENAALSAVVASVATAYPFAAGETLLVLLSVRDYIRLDRSRMANEQQVSGMAEVFPSLRADHQIYEWERREANALPHRIHDLETAIANLQLGAMAIRVEALLDQHLMALPPREQQDNDDRLWRLAIHRMDLRQYNRSDNHSFGDSAPDVQSGKPQQQYVRLDLKPPEADVQAMVDEVDSRLAKLNARSGVLMWGVLAFKRDTAKYDPSQWTSMLNEAQSLDRELSHEDISRHAPGFVAATCIRDRWDEMTTEQRAWCVETVCAAIFKHADDSDHLERAQRNSLAADRPAAFVLPLLLRKSLDIASMDRVRAAFAVALTHPVEEVQWYAACSIDEGVWATDRALALRCVNAIAAEAAITDEAYDAEAARPYHARRDLGRIMSAATADIRARFWKPGAIAEDAFITSRISHRFGANALNRVLVILGHVPHDALAIAAYSRASHALAGWWTTDDSQCSRGDRDYETESRVSKRVTEFLMRTSPESARQVLAPLLAVVDHHSRELQSVMQELTNLQDTDPNTTQYWFLWGIITDAVKHAKWLSRLSEDRYPTGSDLLAAVFLTLYWKDQVRHWRFLEGYAHLVHALLEALPPTSVVLGHYTNFLYHIGERSLPDAFANITAALQRGDPQVMLVESDTVFILEVLLQRYVYGRPLEVKRDNRIREAVLFLLDRLVESGSSAAFRMRDDFVTPVG